MATYEEVFENNQRWVASTTERDPAFFDRLAEGQWPEFLFIGCSDSRVPPSVVTGLEPGHLFVHRNVANVVLHSDTNVQSVIEYAVTHLKVKHIVVCGHSNCGGVGAAMGATDLGVLNPYLRAIRDVYYANRDELDALEGKERYDRLIALNVEQQARHVLQTPAVQKRLAANDGPSVHGWVFALETGLLTDLELDFSDELDAIAERYALDI